MLQWDGVNLDPAGQNTCGAVACPDIEASAAIEEEDIEGIRHIGEESSLEAQHIALPVGARMAGLSKGR